jgi:toxin-antitoxin system PIN domain toxin
MTAWLLDINVLIALLDINHTLHARAVTWFLDQGRHDWRTCPTTQNGLIRIMSGRAYGPTRFATGDIADRLRTVMHATTHSFLPDDATLLDSDVVDLSLIGTGGDVTDAYLLRLATAHGITLVTMDGRLDPTAVVNGDRHLYVIQE